MLTEALPRLVVRLQSAFPEAKVTLAGADDGTPVIRAMFPNHPNWRIECLGSPIAGAKDQFQFIESALFLHYDSLQKIREEDFLRLVASENFGLRGVSLIAESKNGRRLIRVKTGFVGQKGRTRDEGENLTIDVLSLLRFARLLEDRIQRSTAAGEFCYEMYHSQYISGSRGRNRYINYARSVFQGSTERVFGQISGMLRSDFGYDVQVMGTNVAKVTPPKAPYDIVLRIPDEVPMLTCFAPLHANEGSLRGALELTSRLNARAEAGHFELSADGTTLSFVAWKHLTNDLRLYSLDHMVKAVNRAEEALQEELSSSGSRRAA